jgi:hypothetical protein
MIGWQHYVAGEQDLLLRRRRGWSPCMSWTRWPKRMSLPPFIRLVQEDVPGLPSWFNPIVTFLNQFSDQLNIVFPWQHLLGQHHQRSPDDHGDQWRAGDRLVAKSQGAAQHRAPRLQRRPAVHSRYYRLCGHAPADRDRNECDQSHRRTTDHLAISALDQAGLPKTSQRSRWGFALSRKNEYQVELLPGGVTRIFLATVRLGTT